MAEETKDLIKSEESQVTLRKSGHGDSPAGFDEVDERSEIIMPRIAVLQALSEMVVEGKGSMGQLANSLTKENFGNEVLFIPLFLFKTRIQFKIGEGMVMMSRDNQFVTVAKGEFAKYQGEPIENVPGIEWNGDKAPSFNLVYNFPILIPGRMHEFPLCLTMMRTGAKEAKKFISMARVSNEDFFSKVYKISTKIEKNDKGTYAVPVIEVARRATNEEYSIARKQFEILYKRKEDISVDLNEEPLADPNLATE